MAEIRRLVTGFAGMGTWKVRLTGGEPTLRRDFLDIAQTVSDISGIRKLAFTTNGYHLPQRAQDYYKAGLRAINISVDSLDPKQFQNITGHDRLQEVMDGVHAALDAGFESVKVNAVLLKNTNEDELNAYLEWAKNLPISLRFIELMRTGDNQDYFKKYHLSANIVREKLLAQSWQLQDRLDGAGPAAEYRHPDYQGSIGLIAPYSKDFCKGCNRLRVSAKGDLHLCLFGQGGHSVRHLLQHDEQCEELQQSVMTLLSGKRESHLLQQDDSGQTRHLASIGG